MSTVTKSPVTESKSPELTSRDYLFKAKDCYGSLATHFDFITLDPDHDNPYWVLGCILDSIIDFLNLAVPAQVMTLDDAQQFLNSAAKTYLDNKKQGAWYDDWAWWGIATSKVYDAKYSELFGNDTTLQENFKTICRDTFQFVKFGTAPYRSMGPSWTGTTNAYNYVQRMKNENPENPIWIQFASDVEPKCNKGCWQRPMVPYGINRDPDGDPSQVILGPFQDSVMNGLYYIFTQRTLGQDGLAEQEDVDNMASFYSYWMTDKSLKNDTTLYCVLPNYGCFRERVSRYENKKFVEGYIEDLTWIGDQGLMLSALTQQYMRQSVAGKKVTLDYVRNLIGYVCCSARCDIDNEHRNVIMPWWHYNEGKLDKPPGGDYGDYFSGTGVFMRGVLEVLIGIPGHKIFGLENLVSAMSDGTKYMDYVFQDSSVPKPGESRRWFDDFNKMATFLVASQVFC